MVELTVTVTLGITGTDDHEDGLAAAKHAITEALEGYVTQSGYSEYQISLTDVEEA